MGVLNVTPDSFSDGGSWAAPQAAAERGLELVAQGADIVDVGGESTRPGASRPSEREEMDRVVPVVRSLSAQGITTSIDTMRSSVAAACIEEGANIVNDVSGGLADPAMANVVAGAEVDYVAMHWRGHSDRMNAAAVYDDVVAEVIAHLQQRAQELRQQGVTASRLILDPGFGFAKESAHNWTLLAALGDFTALGYRVLVGTSRKRFLGVLPRVPEPIETPDRDVATAATSVLAAQAGAWAVRVHDVPSTAQALGVWGMAHRG